MSKKVTRRKLQFAGNSSYVLTIPKAWIKSAKLDKKDSEVMIEELADGSLRIYPESITDVSNEINDLSIQVGNKTSSEEVIRFILAGYLNSKSKISINSKKNETLPANLTMKIEDLTQKLWGSEIITQSAESVVLHDALDPTQLTLLDIIQRAFNTASHMLTMALEAIEEKDNDKLLQIQRSENTLDKLYYFALRQLYQASNSILFANSIGINPSDVIDYHLLIKNIERIGDHANNISKAIQSEKDAAFNNELIIYGQEALEACKLAVNSFLMNTQVEKRYAKANEAIILKENIVKQIGNLDLSPSDFSISKSILRIADYASDIAELQINRFIISANNVIVHQL
ncbi:MAG: hypothetical protein INQ03_02945 [Candidatus Heimdallarchaeota archaeon]|nr:hypothetical protein [Candidatus Heimdallarchaeota archaeon]